MKAMLLTAGIFCCVAGGESFRVGTSIAQAFGMSALPGWAPHVILACGAAAIIECCLRTEVTEE